MTREFFCDSIRNCLILCNEFVIIGKQNFSTAQAVIQIQENLKGAYIIMKNRVTAMILGACLLLGSSQTVVMADPVFSDTDVTTGNTGTMVKSMTATGEAMGAAGNAADFSDGTEEEKEGTEEKEVNASEAISDGDMNKMAYSLVEKTEEEAKKYMEEKEAAKKAAEEKAAEEAKKKREEYRKKAQEEARKKAEEARQRAEEERLAKRQEIVDFALQFEGNPYVYGGTSLTNGADCSGFVMSVFKEFGYELPRVAAAQYSASKQKSLEDIEPGDLVFYGDYGIDHVALYIGNNQIIHASTAATGIKISDFTYRQPAGVGSYLK